MHRRVEPSRQTVQPTNAQIANAGMRQQVPFERWFYDQVSLYNSQPLSARFWALCATLESSLRVTAEIICLIYSRIIAKEPTEHHREVLNAQWRSLGLSLLAIVSPSLAQAAIRDKDGKSTIGDPDFQWGTQYIGERTTPWWQLACRQYPNTTD